jgi:HK97 family phage prohead protease
LLWQHDETQPIGVWTDFAEDDKGLYLKGRLATDVTKGQEAYSLLKMGAITGMSIGFVSKQWAYEKDTDIRTLTEIELWEVSLVTFPANSKARITQVKSIADVFAPKDAERILRDAGFSRSDATAFVSRVMRMGDSRSDSADSAAELRAALNRLHTLLK